MADNSKKFDLRISFPTDKNTLLFISFIILFIAGFINVDLVIDYLIKYFEFK